MEISVHVLLYILILISGKARNGICISQEEGRIISKRQIDLLPVGTEVHIKARQSTRRPQCLQNEHGPNCTYCVARDTCEEGHFTCDVRTGNKICLPGYQGQNCRISTKHASNYYDVTCPENTCRNGGSCASGHCCCREGFTGILCEIEIIECKNNSCLNGGICKDLIGKYECLCKPTFRGNNCEIPVSAHVQTTPSRDSGCQSNSCRNNGTCLEDTFLTYCLCPTYYTGEQCETHIGTSSGLQNSCPENYFGLACRTFCKPQDSCFGHYVCDKSTGRKICMGGWHGQNCDTRNLPQRVDPGCPNHGCKNDGQCFHNGCCCRNNYTGDNCQIESIGCLSNPCKNNATCTNQGNGFICECLQNFTGKMCENDIKYSTVEPKATDAQNTHSTFHTYTFSAAASNIQHISSTFTDHISSNYPMQSSFTSTLALSNVIHSSIKSNSVLPSTEISAANQISVVYTDISNTVSNHLTGKSESHISATESHISPTLTIWNTSPSSLYFGSVTTYSQLSSSTITARQSHLKSISVEILPSQGTLPMSLLGITSKPYGNMRTRSSASNFISFSKSFETSSFMYIPKYSSSTSLNVLITSTFDSSLSVKDGTMSEHIDRFSANTLSSEFVGIHTSKVRISPTVVDPSFSDHTDSNTLLSSSFDSLSLSHLVATSASVSTNMLETSILYKTSTKRFPTSSKSSVSSVDSAYISSSSNTISADINSAHVRTTTPPISFSFSETAPFIHQNSLSDSIPIIRESTTQKTTNLLTSNVASSKFTNIVVSPNHTGTSALHNIQPTTVQKATLLTSTQMPTYINNMDRDSSEYMSTTEPTTKINIVPTPSSVSYHNIDFTIVSSIKPSLTIKPSDSAMDRLSTFSLNGVSSAVDSVIPTLSGTVRTFSETSKQAMQHSDSMVIVATGIKTIAGINSNNQMHLENHESRIHDSLYISPTSTSSASSTTSYVSHSSSLHTNINRSSTKSNIIVTTTSKTGNSITTSYIAVAPAISSSISSNSSSSIVTMKIVKTAASSIVPNTATAKTTTSSIHASTEASSSLYEKPTVSLAPTSSRHSANVIQSTHVDFVSPTMLITDLNSESNEGISKSWRIALIVIGCVLFVIAVIFLMVFLSVRQRRKDSRTISQSPADIQDYSKEHFSEQPDFHNPTYEIENDSDDDSVKYDIYVVNE